MPSRATLFKVMKSCAASQLKSLHGTDNYASEGVAAIEVFEKTIDKFVEHGLQLEKVVEIKEISIVCESF